MCKKLYSLLAKANLRFFILTSIFLSSCVTDGGEDINEVINYIKVGDKLPEDWGYNEFNTNDFTGKHSLLVLFTTTCPDCLDILPEIEKVWLQLKDNPGYKVIAVARGQKIDPDNGFWEAGKKRYTIPVINDEGKNIFNLFANRMIPRIYLINPEGVVTHMWIEKLDVTAEQLIELMK